jgi:hypothetical protein
LRSQAVGLSSPARLAEVESSLEHALGRLFALQEAYPDLKANQQFSNLGGAIDRSENDVQKFRLICNDAIKQYNQQRGKLPYVLIAGFLGFRPARYLDLENAESPDASVQKQVISDDGDRISELLGTAGRTMIGATKTIAEQGKLLAEREYENTQLKQAKDAAERTAKELRLEVDALSLGGHSAAVEKLRSEKAAVEEQLRVARNERAKLQRDINAIQQQAESSWATERMENALLRERINDIAAEVAKLAIQLEGPNSAIEAMLAAEPAAPKVPAPANDTVAATAPEGGGTLAERIRALQSHASRARQQGA